MKFFTFLIVALSLNTFADGDNSIRINGSMAQRMYESLNVSAKVDDPTFEDVKFAVKEGADYSCTYSVGAENFKDAYVCVMTIADLKVGSIDSNPNFKR